MTAQYVTDPLATASDAVAAAREHVLGSALTPSPGGRVGLELEFHLVDRRAAARRPAWPEVQALVAGLPALPAGSRVTVEPGGQLELSTPPAAGVGPAVAALRRDEAALRAALAAAGYGAAPLGADPARPPQRINPGARYVAMEQHFTAVGCGPSGRAMMTATAALQVNLDAGPAEGWAARVELVRAVGPVLVAVSASSPCLGGAASGWASMRQQAWHGIDAGRSDPVPPGDPRSRWADYALSAPVMLVRDGAPDGDPDGDRATAVTRRVPFTAWLAATAPFERRPTLADLDYHLTTLFPPVRPRGYLEIRCLDATPDRWWPALAAVTATLIDDPVAADAAAEACAPVRGRWRAAARDGLGDPAIRAAARACLEIAARRCPADLAAEVAALADLVTAGRTPGDVLRERIAAAGPVAALAEVAGEQ